ncbi:hypothetical protein B0H13DRAFT_2348866 [Mycena leptocephala]|nr:hypothetical protein B0H13DRAFT_2348866 [Mycena leptocephala]
MYYCDPPLHADPGFNIETASGFWLVTSDQCRSPGPGLYTSWQGVLAVCAGIQDAEPVFHKTLASALPSWYECCRMGQHTHPTDSLVSPSKQGPGAPNGQAAYSPGMAHVNTQYAIGADHNAAPTTPAAIGSGRPTPTTTLLGSPAQSHLAHSGAGGDLSFAVRGGEVVYSEIGSTFQHFEQVRLVHGSAELMGMHNYFKALFFASGMDEYNAEQMGRLHVESHSISAQFGQGSPGARDPVMPTPCPRDASIVAKPGPSNYGACPKPLNVSPAEKKQASLKRLVAIQESLQAASKPSPAEKKESSLKRLVAIQESLLQQTHNPQQLQQQQQQPAGVKEEKPVAVKRETPGTVQGKGKAKVNAGYKSGDFYTDDEEDFAHLLED